MGPLRQHPLTRAVAFGLAACITSGCVGSEMERVEGPGAAPTAAPEIAPLPGTAATIRELAAIYRDGLENPRRYGHLNRRRAEMWRAEIGRREGPLQMMARYQYAAESLNAGDPAAAILEIERLMAEAGPEGAFLTSTNKPLFELLAIAHLRMAERDNRGLIAAPEASILPPARGAVYRDQDALREAIAAYVEILTLFPQDLQSRWLLNLAYLNLGAYPDSVPPGALIPGFSEEGSAELPRFQNVAPMLGVDVDGIAGGLSLEDFNEDGFVDILATARGLNDQLRLFFADGRGGFVDQTGAAGLLGLVGGSNTAHADYDNDGFDDVLVLRGGWLGAAGAHPNSLLKNNGNGTFEDVAVEVGLDSRQPTQTAAWADFDNDGWLDLFIGNESGDQGGGSRRSELYLNDGSGRFTEVSEQVGIDVFAFVKGVAWGDVDNDGLSDLYLSILGGPNKLFLNRGGSGLDDWRFEEVSAVAGVEGPPSSFPVFFWDYDNDGWEDLFVAAFDVTRIPTATGLVAAAYLGLHHSAERNRVYRNNGDRTFTDVAPNLGLDLGLWAQGINFGDLDNDGFPDVYIGTGTPDLRSLMPNRMFLNHNGERFHDVTFDGGVGHLQKGQAIAFADFDRDGDQDIYAVMGGTVEGDRSPNVLFRNPGFAEVNAWVALQLEGRTANRSALGARIRITYTDTGGARRVVHRTVSTGGSFGASTLQQEIGLGGAERIEELRITWPNRDQSVDVHRDLDVNVHYKVVEGMDPERLGVAAVPLRVESGR